MKTELTDPIGPPPPHVAIIMDGSGRWATGRGLPRPAGHRAGRAAVRRTIAAAQKEGVPVLTFFTFSTDNWQRPEPEVSGLLQTFEEFFRFDAPALAAENVRFSVIGRRDRLPASLLEAILAAEAASASKQGIWVRLAIDYSGRDAIFNAARRFQSFTKASTREFAKLLDGRESLHDPAPDVDLLIRTGGELRLSNCPLWEIAYAELYFTSCLWPDFGSTELDAALREFHTRQRRFGRIPVELPEAVVK